MNFGSFEKLKRQSPYLISLIGEADSGKTTLVLELIRKFNPAVVVPMDQRPAEFARLLKEGVDVFPVTNDSDDWRDMETVLNALRQGVPRSNIELIVWDSATPGFREEIAKAEHIARLAANQRRELIGSNNRAAAYRDKSLWMEDLGSVANLGRHVVWISHEWEGRDERGQEVLKTTITPQEMKKFTHNLNLKLRTFRDDRGAYAVEILWARDRPEMWRRIYKDEKGFWDGIWDRLLADYDKAEIVEFWDREYFSGPDEAVALAYEIKRPDGSKLFNHINEAQQSYDNLKAQVLAELRDDERSGSKPAVIMATRWKDKVRKRLDGEGAEESAPKVEAAPA